MAEDDAGNLDPEIGDVKNRIKKFARGNAIFDSQAEGLYKGFEYDNIEDALAKFISQIGGEALDTHVRAALLNLTDAGGEKLA